MSSPQTRVVEEHDDPGSGEPEADSPGRTEEDVPEEAMESYVDSGATSGPFTAEEDWVRANSRPVEHDGRAPTRTTFYAHDAETNGPGQRHRDPSDRRSWASLAKWQDGVGSDISRGGQNWWADKQRWVDTFADPMGASTYHTTRAKHVIDKIEMQTYQSGRINVETVIVGILSLLIDADVRDFDNRSFAREGTQELLDDLDITMKEYEHVRTLLRKNDKEHLFPDRA